MGANLAGEVADEKFCETTIGCKDKELGHVLRDLIQTDYFRVVVVDDTDTVEVCGALKVLLFFYERLEKCGRKIPPSFTFAFCLTEHCCLRRWIRGRIRTWGQHKIGRDSVRSDGDG